MRAVDIKNGTGPADSLFINDNVPTPGLRYGEILVRVKAFGLNRMDLLQREGRYPVPPHAPRTLGVDFAGVVVQVGEGAEGFKEGEEVFGLASGGAYAELIAAPQETCIHMPEELSYEQAAGLPEVWMTATQALWRIGDFKPGESVLIHAGASGVGIAAIQLALSHGASAVFVTAGSPEKLEFCTHTLGATAAYNYKTQDFSKEILSATSGSGVDVIIDFAGQSHFQKNIDLAAVDGRIVMLAFLSGAILEGVNIAPIVSKRLRIEGSNLRNRNLGYLKALRDRFVDMALPKLKSSEYKLFIERTFSWNDVIEAHKLMESNKTQGKIICLVD